MWVAGHFDWIAMRAQPLLRVSAMGLVIAVSGIVYFGALLATGFRLADFKRVAK
jgi:putative peptidoglycan lipid II flippase